MSDSLIRVYSSMSRTGRLYHVTSPHSRKDYDVYRALKARDDGDSDYFLNTLPAATASSGIVTDAPDPPSERGWTQINYPALNPADIGSLVKNVLIEPTYPLLDQWNDPNPAENLESLYIGEAPDSSTAIEVRFFMGQVPQFASSYIPLITSPSVGRRWAGISFEVWTEAGFDWGAVGTDGKLGLGMYAGATPSTGGVDPDDQLGVTVRNTWVVRAGGPTNIRITEGGDIRITESGDTRVFTDDSLTRVTNEIYSYHLNRIDNFGEKSASVDSVWTEGQWQTVEYEGFINHPGFANGFCRIWVDGVCIGELTGCIFAISDEWMWGGPTFSNAWQEVAPSKDQKRWIRNIRAYHP